VPSRRAASEMRMKGNSNIFVSEKLPSACGDRPGSRSV